MTVEPREDLRRKQILEGAFSCFSRRGFDSITMDEIAKESGLSKGAVYWYFKSKDELILALCEAWIARNDLALERMAKECSLDQLLFEFPRYLFSQTDMAIHYKFFFHLWARSTENQQVKERVASMYEAHRRQASDLILGAIRQKIFKPHIEADKLARQILALFDGLTVQWHYDPDLDLAENWDAAVKNLLNGVGSSNLHLQE